MHENWMLRGSRILEGERRAERAVERLFRTGGAGLFEELEEGLEGALECSESRGELGLVI